MSNDPTPNEQLVTRDQPILSERRSPPLLVWGFVTVCIAVICWLQHPDFFESGLGNLGAFAALSLAGLAVLGWFAFFSGYPVGIRLLPVVLLTIGILALLALFRLEGFSGAMFPRFRVRWQLPPDNTLSQDLAKQTNGFGLVSTRDDYPRFLGPNADARIPYLLLETNWQSNPLQLIWRQPIGAGWSAFATANEFAVTMEQRGDEEWVSCYRIEDGKLQWWHATTGRHETIFGGVGPRSTPTIDDGLVYANGAFGNFVCLDGSTGRRIWQHDLLSLAQTSLVEDQRNVPWGRSPSPLIVDDAVVVPLGGPANRPISLIAFHKKTGQELWRGGNRQISYASPTLVTLSGHQQILVVVQDFVQSHDITSGKVIWDHVWEGKTNSNASTSQAVAVSDDRVFVSKGYGIGSMLLQISCSSTGDWAAESLWQNNREMKTKLTNVVVSDGYVYGLDEGILSCIELETGLRCWKKGRYGHGQIALVGDHILVLTETGKLAFVEASPDRFRELAKITVLTGQTWNNLSFFGGKLLVRNSEEAVCYTLP